MGNKKRAFEDICSDVLQFSIFNRLDMVDIVRAKRVCYSWRCMGATALQHLKLPWLFVHPMEDELGDSIVKTTCGLLNPATNGRIYDIKSLAPEVLEHCCCVGSSHGFLIFSNYEAVLFLLNPLTGEKFELPPLDIPRSVEGEDVTYYVNPMTSERSYVRNRTQLREYVIKKAILSEAPGRSNNYAVAALVFDQVWVYKHQDKSWTILDGKLDQCYSDIICQDNRLLYAIGDHAGIERWDLTGSSPIKTMQLDLPFPGKVKETNYPSCVCRFYLAESSGGIFSVVRYVCDYVRNGKAFYEKDDDLEIYPYRTVCFHVFKLDAEQKKWEEVKSLDDGSIFLGGNQSTVASGQELGECERNCIYFTDDSWERMYDDYNYGGHDMGVFKLGDGTTKLLGEFGTDKIQPSPCWIVPRLTPV